MKPENIDINNLFEEVQNLKKEMSEMKKLIQSLLQELAENSEQSEADFFDFN